MTLGAFRLMEPLARGASGEVWRAVHAAERLPAAVKVLGGPVLREARHLRQFQDEVRALAALDHPHVVTLLDAGTVPEGVSGEGPLRAGAPWLALEYASDGTVGQRAPTRWAEILDLTVAVLDALAHAHARGLVHRDLKPANLLWCGERDARPGLKLTDFGIAVRFGDIDPDELPAGTPQYMAPEQLGGELADVGPWTDLYSLGCLVWRLTTGALPFEGLKRAQLARAHLTRPLPPFVPRGPVPHGLPEWLHALLAKRPEDRPQRAADALAALILVDGASGHPSARTWAAVLQDDVDLLEVDDVLEDPTGRLQQGIGPPAAIPDWREPPSRRPPELVGAGLGLLLLRDPPVVGRPIEQDLLWDELRAVAETGRSRLVVLRGPVGSGRTRLARWLCARADEVGAARVIWADGGAGGLGVTVRRLLRAGDRAGVERDRWLADVLSDPELAAVAAAWLDDRLPEAARAGVAARLLGRGSDRATILCLDDAHLAPADVEVLAARLGDAGRTLAVAIVDEREVEPALEARLEGLGGLRLPIGPLEPSALRDLLASVVRLEDQLAAEVEERSQGLPAFLFDVVGDWVQRGWLVPGANGYALRPDVSSGAFPANPSAAAARRLERVLREVTPAAAWDLTMAAALGPLVDEARWHGACDDPEGRGLGWAPDGVARRAHLLEQLVRERVAAYADHGFVLETPFRNAVVAQAQERGRWSRVCATAAEVLGREPAPDRAHRGRLLLEAGRPAEALPVLLDAAQELAALSARRALAVWVDAERARQLAGLSDAHPLVAALWLVRARVDLALGDPGAARAHLPRDVGDPGLAFRAALLELEALLASGEHEPAAQLARRLRATTSDLVLVGRLLLAEAEATERSDPSGSLGRLEEAREAWTRAGVTGERMAPLTLRQGLRSRQGGDLVRARALFERVLDEVGARGDARTRVLAGAALAETLARSGDALRGSLVARRAVAAGDTSGVPTVEARLASGICRLLLHELGPAVAELDDALRVARRTGRADLCRVAHAGLAAAHAVAREWGRVHDHLRQVERDGPAHDPVLVDLLHDLARASKAGGYPQLRARAVALVPG